MGQRITVEEPRRTIQMKSGNRLELHNVTAFDCFCIFPPTLV